MKVLLVVPTFHYKEHYPSFLSLSDFPSGLAYIASALEQAGHEVFGCNPNNIPGYVSAQFMLQTVLTKRIKEVQPQLVGLGGLCIDYSFLKDAISVIRSIDPNIPIVLGGQIVTNDAEFIYSNLKPDYAVIGEGETVVVAIANGQRVRGIINSLTKYEITPDIDSLPFPDYEPFGIKGMMDNYSMATRLLYRYSRPYPRPFNIVASRSCPFSCTFCIHGHDRPPYRARSIRNVMEEIRVSYDKYKFNILILLDELFAVKKERLQDFSNAIIKGKEQYGWDFDWLFQTHASAKFDSETLKLAKKAGCCFFSYGLESASPTILKSMNKKIKVEQVIEVIDLAREAGIGFGANLIFGDPEETYETIAESLSFWLKYCQDTPVFLSNLVAYPGSKVFNDARARGMFPDKEKYYENITSYTPNITQMPDQTMSQFLSLLSFLERAWLFVKLAYNVRYEAEGTGFYKVWANCPYCGKENLYREAGQDPEHLFPFIGTSCTYCNRKIRVNIGR